MGNLEEGMADCYIPEKKILHQFEFFEVIYHSRCHILVNLIALLIL